MEIFSHAGTGVHLKNETNVLSDLFKKNKVGNVLKHKKKKNSSIFGVSFLTEFTVRYN